MRDLTDINLELEPLKALADRELASIYGLTGMVYTPHIDAYMQAVSYTHLTLPTTPYV